MNLSTTNGKSEALEPELSQSCPNPKCRSIKHSNLPATYGQTGSQTRSLSLHHKRKTHEDFIQQSIEDQVIGDKDDHPNEALAAVSKPKYMNIEDVQTYAYEKEPSKKVRIYIVDSGVDIEAIVSPYLHHNTIWPRLIDVPDISSTNGSDGKVRSG